MTLGSSIFAFGVKHGAPKPDISTVDAMKKTLLAARAVGYTDPAAGGASGVYFAKMIEKLGIAAEIKAKSKFPPPAGFVGTLLISGEVDIAIPIQTGTDDDRGRRGGRSAARAISARHNVFAAGVGAAPRTATPPMRW